MVRLAALGLSIVLTATAVAWMVSAGVRTDRDGTSLTQAEAIIGWGGLAIAALLLAVSAAWITVGAARRRVAQQALTPPGTGAPVVLRCRS